MPIKHLNESSSSRSPSASPSSKKKVPIWKTVIIFLGISAITLLLLGFFLLTLTLAWISRDLPNPNALLEREIAQSTKIYDRSGEVLLYEIHGDEKRTLITIDQIPDIVKHATIAIEDKDFYKHHGVSWKGLARAFISSVIKRQRVQGTSTLTQQFVKNAILTNERTVTRKLKELLLSLQIERTYSKDEILQLYLNEIPYGSTAYGVESAAQGYFGKSVKDVTLDEAALLAAIPQAPSLYNPYGDGARGDNREALVGRQHYIINLMAEQGYVSKEEAEAAKEIDTLQKLVPRTLGNIKAAHFVMMVKNELEEMLGQRTVESGGLKVITTLDWRLQQLAEKAVVDGVTSRGEQYGFSNAALVAIGPQDGHILSMVGSKDFFDDENDGQVNVALRPRQPGSSFKPIVYAAGFQRGYLPETTLWDVKTQFKTDTRNYAPNNYDYGERGPISIRMALQGSLNIPAVKMLYLVGIGRVLDLADSMGYTTFADRGRFGLSLVLGGGEVYLLEHTAAYGIFANDGTRIPTASIIRVEGPKGDALFEWTKPEGQRIFEPQIARLVSDVLSDNGARAYVFGTNSALTLPGRPVAAKTGTTNDYRDAWTIGYVPSFVAGVWAGNNDNSEMKRGAGGSMIAAVIWQQFMKDALKDSSVESFQKPEPPKTTKAALLGKAFKSEIKIDTLTGKLATEYTPPEYVEEKTFYDAHSILHYVDKENPTGPIPSNPAQDPQYNGWEAAVRDWVEREQWNATGTPPTEYDDVHTAENKPTVRIIQPQDREKVTSRVFTITTEVSANRTIQSARALINGFVIGTSYHSNGGGVWSIEASIPNALGKGFHDMTVEVTDDVGNRSSSKVTINLLADPEELQLQVIDPQPGSEIKLHLFPITVQVQVNDLTDVKRADLYLETPTGEVRLIGSNIRPQENPVPFRWSYIRGPGIYSLYVEAERDDGTMLRGDKMSVSVLAGSSEEPMETPTE